MTFFKIPFYYFDAVMTLMHKHAKSPFCQLVCLWLLVAASGCSWVDSTGAQSTGVNPSVSTNSGLRNAQPVAILEESSLTADLEGEGADLGNWNWSLDEADVTHRCAAIDGFDTTLSVSNLMSACNSGDECRVAIDESSGDGATRFTVQMPRLRAPVALSYRLTATREDGATVSREQFLCGISINEAPLANDDHYIVLANDSRIVDAQDADSLLRNDLDDNDVRNQSLRVLTTPVTLPVFAAHFSLDSEGGFIYQPVDDLPESSSGYIEDSFVYSVTDGLHTVNATAIVRIVKGNRGPLRVRRIADITVDAASQSDDQSPVQIELSRYFVDPDNDTLSFSISPDTLPANSNAVSLRDGLLILEASNDDVGQWLVEVNATDGLDTTSDIFVLTVRSSSETNGLTANSSPTVTDIKNRIVQNTFSYDVSGFFTDTDGDTLSFTAVGLPDDIAISRTGVIQGTSDDDNHGSWFIQVTGSDNRGGTVTDGFLLVIN